VSVCGFSRPIKPPGRWSQPDAYDGPAGDARSSGAAEGVPRPAARPRDNDKAQRQRAPGGMPGALRMDQPDDVLLSREIHPTIIGAEAFHGPVREGKGWFHLAMVVRLETDDRFAGGARAPTRSDPIGGSKADLAAPGIDPRERAQVADHAQPSCSLWNEAARL
jgi:hypothetical protein